MDYQKTGFLIVNLRKEKGLTQKELADKLGITDRAVSKWERGLGCPDISLLDDLSRILDISILEILKGRKLDKDEIVNNENIIASMNYSKESFKFKLKRYFNFISILLITIIILMIIIFNLKSIYYLNKTYHNNPYNIPDDKLFVEIDNNIAIIKNNRGIYSEEDYLKILAFVNKLENNLKEQNNEYYYDKNDYTYPEIAEFYYSHQNYIYFDNSPENAKKIYEIVHNYNPIVVDNIVNYYTNTRSLLGHNVEIFEQLKTPYYNDKQINNEIVTFIKLFIELENRRDNMLLKDIIEVGDINE